MFTKVIYQMSVLLQGLHILPYDDNTAVQFIIRMMPCGRPECELDRFTTDSPTSAFSVSAAPRLSRTGRMNNAVNQTRILITHNVTIYEATICSTFSQRACGGKWHKWKLLNSAPWLGWCHHSSLMWAERGLNTGRGCSHTISQLSCWHAGGFLHG